MGANVIILTNVLVLYVIVILKVAKEEQKGKVVQIMQNVILGQHVVQARDGHFQHNVQPLLKSQLNVFQTMIASQEISAGKFKRVRKRFVLRKTQHQTISRLYGTVLTIQRLTLNQSMLMANIANRALHLKMAIRLNVSASVKLESQMIET